jgi:hypothetical protein
VKQKNKDLLSDCLCGTKEKKKTSERWYPARGDVKSKQTVEKLDIPLRMPQGERNECGNHCEISVHAEPWKRGRVFFNKPVKT